MQIPPTRFPQCKFSVSATTRPMRSGEEHGKDYFFLSSAFPNGRFFAKSTNTGAATKMEE